MRQVDSNDFMTGLRQRTRRNQSNYSRSEQSEADFMPHQKRLLELALRDYKAERIEGIADIEKQIRGVGQRSRSHARHNNRPIFSLPKPHRLVDALMQCGEFDFRLEPLRLRRPGFAPLARSPQPLLALDPQSTAPPTAVQ